MTDGSRAQSAEPFCDGLLVSGAMSRFLGCTVASYSASNAWVQFLSAILRSSQFLLLQDDDAQLVMRVCKCVCTHLVIFPVQDDDPQLVVGACERMCMRLMIFLLQDEDAQLAKRVCERVCAHLSNMNAEVRWSAVKLLGMVGGKDGSQVLIKLVMQLLTDEVARVREAALGAVMCLADGQEWAAISAIQESIVDTVGSNDRRLRRRALHVLEALSGGAEKGTLMEFVATSAGSSQYMEVRSHHHTFSWG